MDIEHDRITVNEMAGLCCVVPQVIRRWITEGRLDMCDPVKVDDGQRAQGKFAERWALSKAEAMRYAEEYKGRGMVK